MLRQNILLSLTVVLAHIVRYVGKIGRHGLHVGVRDCRIDMDGYIWEIKSTGCTNTIWESDGCGSVNASICSNREPRKILWPSYLAVRLKPNQSPSSDFDTAFVLVENRVLLRGRPALLMTAACLGYIRHNSAGGWGLIYRLPYGEAHPSGGDPRDVPPGK
ncbi:hypothetical protein F5883DRAFT_550820 [Diaporthe sp. PMI_573]|jgi:hypothetical protein|nr:hypothetical protein F5883DRAFT_550820 [Diaporthaceae sp. PMI_573]